MVVRSWKQLAASVEAIAPPLDAIFTAKAVIERNYRIEGCHFCCAKLWIETDPYTVGL